MSYTLFPHKQQTWESPCPNQEWWGCGPSISFRPRSGPPRVDPGYPGEKTREKILVYLGQRFREVDGFEGIEDDLDTHPETGDWHPDMSVKAKVLVSTAFVLAEDRYIECKSAGCGRYRDRLKRDMVLPASLWPEWDDSIIHFLGCYLNAKATGQARQ